MANTLRHVKEAGLIPINQVCLCVAADEARWTWQQAKKLHPSADRLLDHYLYAKHVHALATLQYGESLHAPG